MKPYRCCQLLCCFSEEYLFEIGKSFDDITSIYRYTSVTHVILLTFCGMSFSYAVIYYLMSEERRGLEDIKKK